MVGNIQDTCSKLDQTQLPLNLYKFGKNRLPLMESFWVGEERKWKRVYIIFMHCKSFASQGLWKTPVCNKPKSHSIKYSRMWLGANIGTLCASHSLFKKKLNNVSWKIINCSFFKIVVLFEWKYNLKGMYIVYARPATCVQTMLYLWMFFNCFIEEILWRISALSMILGFLSWLVPCFTIPIRYCILFSKIIMYCI